MGLIIPVDVRDHFTKVCRSPDRFDLGRDQINEAYRAGRAGAIRLMELLLDRGWIRVSDKDGIYLVEFDSWSLSHRGHIRSWMAKALLPSERVYLVSRDGKLNRMVESRGQL